LNIRENEHVHWSGRFRPALTGQGVYPRPVQNPLPIWIGVRAARPESFARAGALGLPLMVAIIGGDTRRFPVPGRSLSRDRRAFRAFARPAHGGVCTRSAMSPRRRRRRPTSSIPATPGAIAKRRQGTWVGHRDPGALRCPARSRRRAADWRGGGSGGEDPATQRGAGGVSRFTFQMNAHRSRMRNS
jgi:hypothetical protein